MEGSRLSFSLCLVLNLSVTAFSSLEFSRYDFPTDFIFWGRYLCLPAFQDGRTPSTWDTFAHAGHAHGATGDIACDEYHKYKVSSPWECSSSWLDHDWHEYWKSNACLISQCPACEKKEWRMLTHGGNRPRCVSILNLMVKGLFQSKSRGSTSKLLSEQCIQILPSLGDKSHLLVKQELNHMLLYSILICRRKDFTEFADVCFREFGDRVLHWTTLNEGNIFVLAGYDMGFIPPQRCSPPFGLTFCAKGNSSSEPYIAGHHLLLAHASAARLYKKKYQDKQHGFIGINIFAYWFAPLTNTTEDIIATQRAKDFYLGWFLDPLVSGDYPEIVKKNAGARIPAFTKNECKQVKGSLDFIGINHYLVVHIKDNPEKLKTDQRNFAADVGVDMIYALGPSGQFPVMPWGLQGVLEYFKQVYGNPPIYIHENGKQMKRNTTLNDTARVEYIQAYMGGLLDAIRNGSNARGYFIWSFLDVLEVTDGYESSFGLYYVDLDDPDLKRYPKALCTLGLTPIHPSSASRFQQKFATELALKFIRDDFPDDFIFGAGTSAYQVEGAANQDGRSPSTWDAFVTCWGTHGASGDIACDQYHKYKEDVKLMVETGLDAYRFSISWSRLIPNGRGPVNPKGLAYYNNLINELISHGIQPHVTLFHVDLPQVLEDEYEGWLSRRIVKDFTEFADVCFREYGDRVSHWTTLNEGNVFALAGYDSGILPPQRCSPPFGYRSCTKGNSSFEPYIAGHHLLLAHASAARLYKKKYQAKQHGFIGINVFAYWFAPLTNTTEDITATQRAKDFYLGCEEERRHRIPAFTTPESKQVKGSFDFIAINHYFATYIKDNPEKLKIDQRDFALDVGTDMIFKPQNDVPVGEFPLTTWGLQGVLEYLKQVYGNPPIYIHENGMQTQRNTSLNDTSRVKYMEAYIEVVLDAIRNGSNTRGYFTWSFLDVLELIDGYGSCFGLYYVDLDDPDLRRYPKLSAHWYSSFLKRRNMSSDGDIRIEKNKTLFLMLNPFSRFCFE
ncbi:Beta-glucosidase 11 [Vitis vinifera]|uniref:Beta-glucosidase 11 n=1 Tax=Vitis vinifera TaxID=29760 RepID=A0A438KHP4_VITVI|nr:Beta-glucosidase 11 [Vitis vinifera]